MPQLPEPSINPQQVTSNPESQTSSLNASKIVTVCAGGLLLCFFLPWINFFGAKPSGLDIAKTGGECLLVWSIPLFSIITIIAGLTKKGVKPAAQFTGALPFFFLAHGLYDLGADFLQLLEIGGYLNLLLGIVLFIVASRVK